MYGPRPFVAVFLLGMSIPSGCSNVHRYALLPNGRADACACAVHWERCEQWKQRGTAMRLETYHHRG